MTEGAKPQKRSSLAGGRAVLTGFGALLAARIVVGASTLVLFALLTQRLSTPAFGLFGLCWSVSYLVASLIEGGYGMLVVKEVAASRSRAGLYLGAFVPLRLAVGVVVLLVAALTAAMAGWDSLPTALALAVTAANLQVISGVPRDFLIATDHVELAAAHAIVETILRSVVVLVTAVATNSTATVFAAAAAFHLVWAALTVPIVWWLLRPRGIAAGIRAWRGVARASLPFAAFVTLAAIYAQVDVVVVSTLLPLGTAALFVVASRIILAADYVPEAAWRWAFPRLSRASEGLAGRTNRLAFGLLALAVAIAGGVAIGAPFGVPIVFGRGYAAAVLPLVIMAAALPSRYLGHAYGVSLTAAGTQRERARLFAVAMAISITGEVILVSTLGLIGAAVAVLFGSACLVTLWFRAARAALGSELSARPLIVALAIEGVALTLAVAATLAG